MQKIIPNPCRYIGFFVFVAIKFMKIEKYFKKSLRFHINNKTKSKIFAKPLFSNYYEIPHFMNMFFLLFANFILYYHYLL